MQIKLLKKLKAVILLSAIAAICLGFVGAIAIGKTFAQGGDAVPLGYSVDFTAYEYDGNGGVKNFEPLKDSAEINGLILGADLTEPKSLSVWTGNPQAVREGYVVYKISTGDESKLFKTLKLVYTGRVDDWAGNTDCGLWLYAGRDSENLSLVSHLSSGNDGSSVIEFDLSETEGIVGEKECYVKILIRAAQTWVNIEKLSFAGETYYEGFAEEGIEIENKSETTVLSLSEGKNGELSVSVKEPKVNTSEKYEIFYDVIKNGVTIYRGTSATESFGVKETGEYLVKYNALVDGAREYADEYYFYVVQNAEEKGITDKKEGFAYSDFSSASRYRISSVSRFESRYYGFNLSCEATYLTAVSLKNGINLKYEPLASYDGLFEIVLADSDKINYSDKSTKGVYFDFTVKEKTELTAHFSDGKSVTANAVFADAESYGAHELSIRLDSEGKLEIIFDGKIFTFEQSISECFASADKIYLGYKSDGGEVYVSHNDEWNYNGFYEKNNYVAETPIEQRGKSLVIGGETDYLLPVDFTGSFNIGFDFDGLTGDKEVEIAITNKVGCVDFDGKTDSGLYFVIKKTGDLPLMRAYFSGKAADGGSSVTSLGEMMLDRSEGEHSLGFARRAAAPFTGIEIYTDGVQFAAYASCYTVNTDDFVKGGNVYIAFRIKGGNILLNSVLKSDAYAPVMYDENYNFYKISKRTETGYKAGEFYALKRIIMIDYTDGEVPYDLTVYDPNGDEVKIIEKDGQKGFYLDFTGEYSLKYTASDKMGNSAENYIYVEAEPSSDAPRMVFAQEIMPYGRNGTQFAVPRPAVYLGSELRDDLTVYCRITKPDGNAITYVVPAGNLNFVPSDLGIYTFLYFTEANGHTTYAKYKSNIKKNVDHNDSYRNVFDEKYWRGSDSGVTATENGIKISETAYCELPFETEKNGMAITIDVSSLGNKRLGADNYLDCWVSLGIGKNPHSGGFGSPEKGAIYFMLYREDSEYYVNALACDDYGTVFHLFSGYSAGATGTVVISFEKIKNSSTKTDNVNLYINYRKIEYDTVSQYVTYSGISDNESFSYINIYSYGQCPAEYRSAVIKEISLSDQEAPYYNLSLALPKSVKLGDFVELPRITVKDDLDENFKSEYALYDPSGKLVKYANGFTADKEGTYLLVIKAYDKSGNRLNEVIKIRAEAEKSGGNSTGIIIACVAACVLLCGAAIAVVMIVKRKKKNVAKSAQNTDREETNDNE